MNRRQMGDGGHGPFTFRIQDRWPGGDAWVALGEGKLRMTCELLQVDIKWWAMVYDRQNSQLRTGLRSGKRNLRSASTTERRSSVSHRRN